MSQKPRVGSAEGARSTLKLWRRVLDTATNEPEPRLSVEPIEEKADWRATSLLKDESLNFSSFKTFDEVFENRRTRRVINEVSLRETCSFLSYVFAPRQMGKGRLAGLLRKTMVSVGALHPIDVLIVAGPQVAEPILFLDRERKFLTVPILDENGLRAAIEEATAILPDASGHLILFAGDMRRVAKAYKSPETLLWRDGGAATQACSMAAFAIEYEFCPMGFSGSAILSAIGPPHQDFVALGLGLFGS